MSAPEVTLPAWAPSTADVAHALTAQVQRRGGAPIDGLRDVGDFGTDTWPARATVLSRMASVIAEVRATVGRINVPADEPDASTAPMLNALWHAMRGAVVSGTAARLQLVLLMESMGRVDLGLREALNEDYERELKTLAALAALAYEEGGSDGDDDGGLPGSGSGDVRFVDLRGEPLESELVLAGRRLTPWWLSQYPWGDRGLR